MPVWTLTVKSTSTQENRELEAGNTNLPSHSVSSYDVIPYVPMRFLSRISCSSRDNWDVGMLAGKDSNIDRCDSTLGISGTTDGRSTYNRVFSRPLHVTPRKYSLVFVSFGVVCVRNWNEPGTRLASMVMSFLRSTTFWWSDRQDCGQKLDIWPDDPGVTTSERSGGISVAMPTKGCL